MVSFIIGAVIGLAVGCILGYKTKEHLVAEKDRLEAIIKKDLENLSKKV